MLQIRRVKIFLLLLPLIIDIIVKIFMQLYTQTDIGNLFYKGGFLSIYFFYFLFFIFQFYVKFDRKINLSKLEYFIFILSFLLLFYNLLLIFVSVANHNQVNYMMSDFTRSSVFFITLSSLILYFSNKSLSEKHLFFKYLFVTLLIITIIEGIAKIILVMGGRIYGDGLNQYMINIFVLFSLFWISFKTKVLNRKFLIYILIIIAILLTILSLKRGSWVELVLFFILLFFTLTNRKKIYFSFLVLFFISFLVYILNDLGLLEAIVRRFTSTYSSGKLDVSSMGRIVEIKGAIFSLDKFMPSYITGYGHGCSYFLNPDYLVEGSSLYGSSNESIHHIHPMFMMILYRMGIIGLLFYTVPILIALRILMYLIKHRKLLYSDNYIYIYIFAASVAFVSDSIQFLKSNGMYGSFYDGLLFFVVISGYSLIKENKINET